MIGTLSDVRDVTSFVILHVNGIIHVIISFCIWILNKFYWQFHCNNNYIWCSVLTFNTKTYQPLIMNRPLGKFLIFNIAVRKLWLTLFPVNNTPARRINGDPYGPPGTASSKLIYSSKSEFKRVLGLKPGRRQGFKKMYYKLSWYLQWRN